MVTVQLPNDILWSNQDLWYGEGFIVDSGALTCPQQESAGCHSSTLGEKLLRAKNKMAATRHVTHANVTYLFQYCRQKGDFGVHTYVLEVKEVIPAH